MLRVSYLLRITDGGPTIPSHDFSPIASVRETNLDTDPTASAGVTLSPVDDTASRQSTTPPLLESSGGAEGDVTDLLLADDVQGECSRRCHWQ